MKETLRNLLAHDKTERAIKMLLACIPRLEDRDLKNDIIIQSGKYGEYEKQKRRGTASDEELEIFLSKIREAILSLIDHLPDDLAPPVPKIPSPKPGKLNLSRPLIWSLFLIVPVGLLISFSPIFSNHEVTAQVRDAQGAIPLENRGKIEIRFNDNRKYVAPIGKSGQVSFDANKNHFDHNTYTVQLVEVIDYALATPQQEGTYNGETITVTVIPDHRYKTIQGQILNSGQPGVGVEGAGLYVGSESIGFTDRSGRFKVMLNQEKAKEFYQGEDYFKLEFRKDGFKIKSGSYFYDSDFRMNLDPI